MAHSTDDRRLLLGTVGWDRPEWRQAYFPPDLPPDWRLAYYANDCSCVMLPAHSWCTGDRGALERALDEAPDEPRVFLEAPPQAGPALRHRLAMFPPHRSVLLVPRVIAGVSDMPQWVDQGGGAWADPDSGASLVCWRVDRFELRALRERAGSLDPQVQALVLDGPAASPGVIGELRTLLELMGIA